LRGFLLSSPWLQPPGSAPGIAPSMFIDEPGTTVDRAVLLSIDRRSA